MKKQLSFPILDNFNKEEVKLSLFKQTRQNRNEMLYWFPNLERAIHKCETMIKLPKTMIIKLGIERWDWLRSDNYTDEAIREFSDYLNETISEFFPENQTLFIKSGIFSNKFDFRDCCVNERDQIGHQFLSIYYNSMMLGADLSSQVVIREYIEAPEGIATIYNGMPLRTEFRCFYDFNNHTFLGISNYWHPEVMTQKFLSPEDFITYKNEESRLLNEFHDKKAEVVNILTPLLMQTELTGKWSIDVMKNDSDYYLIDMALMNQSALIQQMEPI